MSYPEEEPPSYQTPLEMFQEGKFVKCAAPMVRYSKLPFRLLCRRWGCDLTFTPMITAKDFNMSEFARESEFTTNKYDRPLVVQFAAKDAHTLAEAAERVAKYCDGVDINCGCPQRWVMSEGYGSALLKRPELICEMVRHTASRVNVPVSVKIRVDDDLKKTVELARRIEAFGAAWISVHGRTPRQRSTAPVNFEAIKLVKENVDVPVIANGSVFTLQDALNFKERTGVDGVMSARGILQNPALFAGYDVTPTECMSDWINIGLAAGIPAHTLHQHLTYMLFETHSRSEKREFNTIKSVAGIIDFFETRGISIDPQPTESLFAPRAMKLNKQTETKDNKEEDLTTG